MKQIHRANPELKQTHCRKCGKDIVKNNMNQIVYFCSKRCRKEHRKVCQ